MRRLLSFMGVLLIFAMVMPPSVFGSEGTKEGQFSLDITHFRIEDENVENKTADVFDAVGYFDAIGQATVEIDGMIGRIDDKGNEIVDLLPCQNIYSIQDEKGNSLLVIEWNNDEGVRYQLLKTDGQLLTNGTFDSLGSFINGKIWVEQNGKYGILTMDGIMVGNQWWDGYAEHPLTGEVGYLYSKTDNSIIYISPLYDIWRVVHTDDSGMTHYYACTNGEIYDEPNDWVDVIWLGDEVRAFAIEGYYKKRMGGYAIGKRGVYGLCDAQMNVLVAPQYILEPKRVHNDVFYSLKVIEGKECPVLFDIIGNEYCCLSATDIIYGIDTNSGVLSIHSSEKSELIDCYGTVIKVLSPEYLINECVEKGVWHYTNTKDHSWGFMDGDGNILCELSNEYYDAGTYVDNHNTGTYANGWMTSTWKQDGGRLFGTNTYGYVGLHGDLLYDVDWTGIYDFTANGRARVRTDNGYGFIDETGAYVVEPKYTTCEDFFQTGDQWLAYVADSTGWGYINNNGELICWNRKRTSVKGTTDISLRNANGGVILSIPEGKEFILHGYDEKLGMFSATYGDTEGYIKGTGLMIFRNGNWQAITKDELIEQTK